MTRKTITSLYCPSFYERNLGILKCSHIERNEDIKYLREITQPERRMEGVMSVEGTVQIRMTLRGQEIILLHVSKDDAC